MDATLQKYIDKLNALNDLCRTIAIEQPETAEVWDKLHAIEKTQPYSLPLQMLASPIWAFPCSGTTLPAPVSPLPPPATCWVWRSRIWTRARARSLTARLSARLPT